MELTLETLLARIVALETEVAALKAKPAPVAKASTPRKAGETITFPVTHNVKVTTVEGRILEAVKGQTMSRADFIAHIEAGKYSTRPASVMAYDALVKLAKANPAPVVAETPVVAEPAPIIELVVEPTAPVVNAEPATVVDITPPAAPAAPKARTGRKAQGK